ncbi:MAG: tetratricopeptide repeat protein [Gammaproteobacteria bacterium]|nr:tetratricopeptide repeat protein [Gammaproteobacteria bacterium]
MYLNYRSIKIILLTLLFSSSHSLYALEIQQYIEGKDYAEYIKKATGLKITEAGVVYVPSERKGSLLKIVDGKIELLSISPEIFRDSDTGGIDLLKNGNLVIVNEGSAQVGIVTPDLKPVKLFSKSGGDPGEQKKPKPVAVSINNHIFIGDSGNKQINVFNEQGLYLYSFGRDGAGSADLRKPTHISIDADENVYVLEGEARISIFDVRGKLIKRFSAEELKPLFDGTPEFTAMTTDLDGHLYLADAVTNQVTILDWRKLKRIGRFGALGQARAQYLNIAQLSVNSHGQIAILDSKNKKVEVFQLDQKEFKTPVISDQVKFGAVQDVNCTAIQTFVDGKSLCIKPKKGGIVVLSAAGKELGVFADGVKKAVAIHSDLNTVAIIEGNKLLVYGVDGKSIFSTGRYGSSAGGFQKPQHVFISHGQYYVSDTGNNRVQVFSSDGQFVEEIKASQNDTRLFIEVGPITVDSQQNLYIGDAGGSGLIRVISKERKLITSLGIEADSIHRVTRFYALDIDRQDKLYVLAATDFNDYGIQVYKDFKPYKAFGSAGKNGTDYYFDEVGSMSVVSGDTNSVFINDRDLKKYFRFDLFEYPDAAFGLQIAASKSHVKLEWSSSRSPLIAEYEIQASVSENKGFKKISSAKQLNQTIPALKAGKYTWFRVVSVSGHGLRADPSAARENHFQKILALYEAGQYAEAIQIADKLLKIAPDNSDAMDLLAMSLYQLQDYPRSISVFKQLEDDQAYRNKAFRYQVQAYYQLEQYLEARSLIDEVLAAGPKEVEPYLICTQLSLELDDSIGAVTCAEDGLALHESNIELRYLLGRAYIDAGLAEEGLAAYQTVVDANPDNNDIRLKIAGDMYALGDFEAALGHYDAVSRRQPKSGEAAVGKARALLSLGRDDEAKAIAIKLSGKKETKGDGYYLLGKLAMKQGKSKEAVLRLTRAGKDKPEVVDAWVSLADAYINLGQNPKAVRSLQQGIKHNPEAFELYQLAGQIELEQKRYPEANAYLDKAVSLQGRSLLAQKLYARGLFATRNYRSAATHADLAARIAPEDLDVLTLQAEIANQQGKTGSAIEYLKTAISIDPASPELQYKIGRVYQDANLFDASREHLEKAANINPSWASPQVALGDLFTKRRMFDEAIVAFQRAVELDPSNENRAILNVAFAEKKKSLEFKNNAPQLLLSDLNLQTVFSAAYKKYLDQPIGSVTLQNVGATDYGNLKLSFQIKEYMDFPSIIEIASIRGNETQQFDIKATFNNRILEVDEDTGVQVEVKLTYLRDGQKDDITLTQPMTIYGKNAIVWGDPAMVGSFVTPKDDTLRDYVRRVVNEFQPDPGPLNEKLVSAMAYFSSLTASGTNYIIDPNTPFTQLRDDQIDYVQFPRETLRLKSGDCDDLSVLISAGLENLGINTAFVETPGHLFMMFDTAIPAEDSGLISQDSSLLVIKDDRVWIPIEATMVNTSFTEAWAEGARKYHTALAESNLGIIDLKQAWTQYQPVTLRKASYSIPLPDLKRTKSLVKREMNLLLVKSIDRLVLPYQIMVASNPKNIAARMQIAILYARFGLYDDAEIAFEALTELAPNNSAVYSNQGNLYFLQEDYEKAIDNYTRAASLDSEDGGILINLSMAQYKEGNLNQAASSYKQAKQLDSVLVAQEYEAYGKLLSQ